MTHAEPKTVTPTVTDHYAVTSENAPQSEVVTPVGRDRDRAPSVTAAVMQPRRTSRPLIAIAYGFFALGVGINVWNAWTLPLDRWWDTLRIF